MSEVELVDLVVKEAAEAMQREIGGRFARMGRLSKDVLSIYDDRSYVVDRIVVQIILLSDEIVDHYKEMERFGPLLRGICRSNEVLPYFLFMQREVYKFQPERLVVLADNSELYDDENGWLIPVRPKALIPSPHLPLEEVQTALGDHYGERLFRLVVREVFESAPIILVVLEDEPDSGAETARCQRLLRPFFSSLDHMTFLWVIGRRRYETGERVLVPGDAWV